MPLPSTERFVPDLPAAAGEHLVAEVRQDAAGQLIMRGRFRLLTATRAALTVPPHRALVVATVIGIGGSCHAGLPFVNAALFEDDVQTDAVSVSGWFQVDVSALSGFAVPGVYHITCSLAHLVAGPLRIERRRG